MPTFFETKIPWWPFVLAGIVLAALLGVASSMGNVLPPAYVIAGVAGVIALVVIMQRPEFGAYILIISVYTNISDILTDRFLPSINRPLIALTLGSVIINYLLKSGRYTRFPTPAKLEWALIAFYFAIITSVIATPYKENAFVVILDITKDILVGISIYITLNTEEKLKRGFLVLIVTITALSAMGVFKVVTGSEATFFDMARYSEFGQVSFGELRYGGPIAEPNLWGQVLVSSLPFAVYFLKQERSGIRKAQYLIALSVILLALIYTGSRGAIVALTVITPLLAIDMRIKPINIILGALLFISLLLILPDSYSRRFQTLNVFFNRNDENALEQDESFVQREAVMLAGIEMFRANPVFGVGFGNFGLRYWDYATNLGLESDATDVDYEPDSRYAHSLYVEIISETGLLGFLTFLLFFVTLYLEMYRIRRRFDAYEIRTDWSSWASALAMSVTTFLISGIFLHGIFFRYIWVLIGLCMAAISIASSTQTVKTANSLNGARNK
ncbi:MAG: hypothetical protein HND47_13910 [Chloroflexi bacterium]|nr:hypothetical protein [Chloroflexota bacterium]